MGLPGGASLVKALPKHQPTSWHPGAAALLGPWVSGFTCTPSLVHPPIVVRRLRHRAGVAEAPPHSLHRVVAGEGDEAPKGQ